MTEQSENQPGESAPDAPTWVPSDPEKSDPASGGEPVRAADPTVVKPPVDPTVATAATEPPVDPTVPTAATEPPVDPTVPTAATEPSVTPPPVPPPVTSDGASAGSAPSDRPEIAVGAAFAGGFALAMILKRFAR